jgi:hypothetical protein
MRAIRGSRKVKSVLWIALAAELFWAALRWPDAASVGVCVAFGVFSTLAALSIMMSWRVGRWLGVVGGVALILYAVALILLGSEDVGGLAVSLPWGSALLAFGLWNVVGVPHRAARVA